MNTPIVRLYVFVLLLFAVLVYFTSKWAVFDAEELEEQPENRRAADRRAADPARHDHDRRRRADRREPARGRRATSPCLRARVSQLTIPHVRQPGRLQLRRGRPDRDRARRERPPRRRAERVRLDHRPAPRHPAGGRRHHAHARRRGPAARGRPAHRGRSRPGVGGSVVAIEPETGAVKVMASIPGFDPNVDRRTRRRSASSRPTRARRCSTGRPRAPTSPGSTMKVVTAAAALDSGEFDTDTVLNADSPKEISGFAARELRRRELRRHRHDRRAHQLGQHLLGPGGRAARHRDDGRVHGALRLLRGPGAQLPRRPDDRQRRPQPGGRPGRRRASTSAASRSGRAGRRARLRRRRCRWPRWRRRSPTAATLMKPNLPAGGEGPGRPDDRGARPRRAVGRDQRGDRRAGHRDDDERRQGGHRRRAVGRRRLVRRQDRNRGDRRRGRASTGPGSSASPRPTTRRSPSRP